MNDKMNHRNRYVGVGGLELTIQNKRMVNRVLDGNRLSYGPFTKKFESEFAKMHQSKFGVFTNSGTSALHIALGALKERYGWKDGDEVIVPALTFVATSNTVIYNNLKPVFVDVEEDTFNIDPSRIEEKITEKTRCIIPVHLLGLPSSMGPIMKLARKHNLRIIEDSAETMFAKYMGRPVGSFGSIGCFSTYIAHYIVTGVGGLNTTNDPKLAVMLRSLANHGRDSIYISIDDDNTTDKKALREIISKRFSFVRFGYSFRATELEAALGLSQLSRKEQIVRSRVNNARRYINGLKDLSNYIYFQRTPKDRENVYMLFGIVCKGDYKEDLVNFLEENDIETRDLLPLLNQPIYKKYFGNIENRYPVAKMLRENGFYIGCHQYLNSADIDYVVEKFHEFFKR